MNDLYRLVYTSRNRLPGTEDEQSAAVATILAVAKRNNARVGVTGALLFNAGCFAQVLEGPRAAVEATFERIQRDRRHGDVSVLQCEPAAARGFPNWSMAFVGRSDRGRALWNEIAGRTDFDIGRIEGDRLFAQLLKIVETEETMTDDAAPIAPPRGEALDVGRLRSELGIEEPGTRVEGPGAIPARATPVAPAAPPTGAAAVLRAALDEERGRTTALRRELDDARISLAALQAEMEVATRHRDVWAGRARALAEALCREPETGEVAPEPGLAANSDERHAPVRRAV